MAPIREFCNLERVYGPSNINRFNLFTSINVTGTVANGFSTGEAIQAIRDIAATTLPQGYTYEFSGLTREEAKASNTTAVINPQGPEGRGFRGPGSGGYLVGLARM